MLTDTLDLFTKDIKDIREYMKYIELVNNIESSTPTASDIALIELKDHLKTFKVAKKIFEYKSITISLYGILEKHIGVWIKEYLNHLPNIVSNYNNLTNKFREDHFSLSVKLLGLIGEKRYAKYEHMDKEKVLSKLNSCIVEPSGFQLNSDAFYLQSGNLKHIKISEALAYLDIKLTLTLKIIGMRPGGFLDSKFVNIENKGDELFQLIDELVERRNDIAHGEDIDSIIKVTEFEDYVDFLEGYGKAIFQALNERLIKFEAEHLYQKIENVYNIYGHSILCFEIENNEISVGDSIIVNLLDGGFVKKKITEIQKDSESFQTISSEEPTYIGVNLGGGISKGQTFFIKKAE